MMPVEELLYSSSNGDRWLLVRDPSGTTTVVRHVANPSSGGRVTDRDARDFLGVGGSGPEYAAVRAALDRTPVPGAAPISENPTLSQTPLHDWMMPRLQKLVDDAIAAGFDPLTVTAVLTDILASTALDHQPPTPLPEG
ncbi:MAG: hypothetical protein ACRYHQ_24105 [Janthinobacterium lividum]